MQPGRIPPFAGLVFCLIALTGCGWLGAGEDPPLPGERLAVLLYETDLKPDPLIAGQAVNIPPLTEIRTGRSRAVGRCTRLAM